LFALVSQLLGLGEFEPLVGALTVGELAQGQHDQRVEEQVGRLSQVLVGLQQVDRLARGLVCIGLDGLDQIEDLFAAALIVFGHDLVLLQVFDLDQVELRVDLQH